MDYFFYNTDADALSERPRYRTLIDGGFAAVGGDRQRFGEQLGQLAPDDVLLMYENRIGVVAVGRVRERWDGKSYTVPKYYKESEMGGLTGGAFEYRIAVEWFLDLSEAPVGIEQLRQQFGYLPRGAVRRIESRRAEASQLVEGSRSWLSRYTEGAIRRVSVNAYERSTEAVQKCKEAHGTTCTACDLDFGTVYGAELEGFIHVHHLRPLSEVGGEYSVDPVEDLRPVCPNCHAVIHHGGSLRSIEEVRQLLAKQRDADSPGAPRAAGE